MHHKIVVRVLDARNKLSHEPCVFILKHGDVAGNAIELLSGHVSFSVHINAALWGVHEGVVHGKVWEDVLRNIP